MLRMCSHKLLFENMVFGNKFKFLTIDVIECFDKISFPALLNEESHGSRLKCRKPFKAVYDLRMVLKLGYLSVDQAMICCHDKKRVAHLRCELCDLFLHVLQTLFRLLRMASGLVDNIIR